MSLRSDGWKLNDENRPNGSVLRRPRFFSLDVSSSRSSSPVDSTIRMIFTLFSPLPVLSSLSVLFPSSSCYAYFVRSYSCIVQFSHLIHIPHLFIDHHRFPIRIPVYCSYSPIISLFPNHLPIPLFSSYSPICFLFPNPLHIPVL